MRGALSECVCVRLWPLCAPVNRSQCARGRQNWKFPPHPISDRTAITSSAIHLAPPKINFELASGSRRLRLTFAIRIRMPIFNRWRIRRADSADLSACAWSWWRGARELPARAGARGPAAHCRTRIATPNWRARGASARGPGSAARGPRRVTKPSALWV